MTALLTLAAVVLTALSCLTGALAYALRDFSRARLEDVLERQGRRDRLQPILDHLRDFILVAASLRLLTILALHLVLLALFSVEPWPTSASYAAATSLAAAIAVVFGVGLASSLANYFGEVIIARLDPALHTLRLVVWPVLYLLHRLDRLVFRVSPHAHADAEEQAEQQVEEDVLAVVEEGVKEGVVDETDRDMIESVIEFRDTTAGQIMTARPAIDALPVTATLDEITQLIETSGHSRLPVYENDLDHIVGILYARDLLKHLADPSRRARFDLRANLRKPLYVPETKPLKDLLAEFRLRKVHLAIVLDEYGGTAGLVTIEDVLEELVGEIADEHEPAEPAAVLKLTDDTWEVDARTHIDEANRVIGLNLPEDAGFETLGGYLSSVIGRIPAAGEVIDTPGVRWTVLTAEPTRVVRLKLQLAPPDERPEREGEQSHDHPAADSPAPEVSHT
ncbi:MAG: hemolysin family protein [Tepidisphaerales bacterium]